MGIYIYNITGLLSWCGCAYWYLYHALGFVQSTFEFSYPLYERPVRILHIAQPLAYARLALSFALRGTAAAGRLRAGVALTCTYVHI